MSETLDAQMSDAGDIDISMYSTMATTDSWLSVEASMGDDTFSSGAATFEYTHDGIEIEMGDDDEAITEYEMADGDGYDEELQDVEVYDISQAASPLMVEDHGDQHHEDTDPMHIPSDDPLPVAEPPPLSVEPAVAASSTYDLGERSQLSSPTTVPIVVIHDSDAALQDRSGETTAIAAVSETHVVDGPPAPAVDDYPVSQPSWMIPPALPAVPALLSSEAPELATVESVPDPHHESASSYENYEAHEAGGTTDAAGLQESVAGFEDIDVAATNESGDPHEISEGVYIDPPPPVLLSLPPSAEFGECSLFNLPTSSVPQSPSGSSKPASDEGLHLLLHDRPTLYYEPLSVVFAALREEQCIQNMPGFAEAELVLDAFDLQLCISEDNVYTHEVTLHELNVIHDGSDLNGPLRLRLKVFTPRFVARYTTLRDQIARLSVTDGDDSHVDPAAAQPSHEQADAPHDSEQQAVSIKYPEEIVPAETSKQLDDPHTDRTVDESSSGTSPQAISLALPNSSEDAVQEQAEAEVAAQLADEVAGAEHDADGDVDNLDEVAQEGVTAAALDPTRDQAGEAIPDGENGDDADEYQESEETLDADDVHEGTLEEGGDYVEHAVYPDDEDEFGEDLSDELGGEAADQAYPHIGATDDTIRYAQDAEETRGYPDDTYTAVVDPAHSEDTGLNDEASTDATAHSNSLEAPGGVEDSLPPNSAPRSNDATATSLTLDAAFQDHATATDEDELDDNWDDPDLSPVKPASTEQSDVLSRKSSTTTLASRTSKRAYEEVELDDFDDDDESAPDSPDAKRARVE
ncbi:hypothetical protein OH76DRAFT_1404880 [Lentinus brumalis]|uniref:Uncharacterized protein n=1 Tax=Lentinus brumalis TaxID=2498619 RepID=A0A371D6Y2_9APHY|nr:hypothetical protein OH76DRAFT_1404880 [Polyporus brumalis]